MIVRHKKTSALIGLIALMMISLAPSTLMAQASGNTSVDITLPNIVILHYFSSVSLTVDQIALENFLTGGGNSIDEGAVGPIPLTGSPLTGNLAIVPSALTGDPSSVGVTLQNAWAIRSIGTSGNNTTVAIAAGATSLTAGTGETLDLSAFQVSNGGAPAASISFPHPGLVNPELGDVLFTMDLTNATVSGNYSGGDYTITATVL